MPPLAPNLTFRGSRAETRDKMFVLVVHTITDVTAKVPFAMMVLQDALKTKAVPSHLKVGSLPSTYTTASYASTATLDGKATSR